jgi:hypothetical protein
MNVLSIYRSRPSLVRIYDVRTLEHAMNSGTMLQSHPLSPIHFLLWVTISMVPAKLLL